MLSVHAFTAEHAMDRLTLAVAFLALPGLTAAGVVGDEGATQPDSPDPLVAAALPAERLAFGIHAFAAGAGQLSTAAERLDDQGQALRVASRLDHLSLQEVAATARGAARRLAMIEEGLRVLDAGLDPMTRTSAEAERAAATEAAAAARASLAELAASLGPEPDAPVRRARAAGKSVRRAAGAYRRLAVALGAES